VPFLTGTLPWPATRVNMAAMGARAKDSIPVDTPGGRTVTGTPMLGAMERAERASQAGRRAMVTHSDAGGERRERGGP
jgi:hypothetical protein